MGSIGVRKDAGCWAWGPVNGTTGFGFGFGGSEVYGMYTSGSNNRISLD